MCRSSWSGTAPRSSTPISSCRRAIRTRPRHGSSPISSRSPSRRRSLPCFSPTVPSIPRRVRSWRSGGCDRPRPGRRTRRSPSATTRHGLRRALPAFASAGANGSRREHGGRMRSGGGVALAIFALLAAAGPARAQDGLRLAVGQRGLWDTSISDVGQRAGIFKKHGVTLEILYTQGSGETQQAVFAGSVDIGVSVGVMGALAGYSKGAPVRIIGNEITGAGDVYWYVMSDSPIKTIKDFDGKTIAFSTVGA